MSGQGRTGFDTVLLANRSSGQATGSTHEFNHKWEDNCPYRTSAMLRVHTLAPSATQRHRYTPGAAARPEASRPSQRSSRLPAPNSPSSSTLNVRPATSSTLTRTRAARARVSVSTVAPRVGFGAGALSASAGAPAAATPVTDWVVRVARWLVSGPQVEDTITS